MTASSQLPDIDRAKADRLRQTKRWATAVLVVLAASYLATFFHSDPPQWLYLIRRMAEAGMIGGLADWFAVVALFRHPLGLKIPHTALLPRNKARAAESVGQFFKTYFLNPTSLAQRVRELAPARRAAEWLSDPEHAAVVAQPLTQAIAISAKNEDSGLPLNEGLRKEISNALVSKSVSQGMAKALKPVLEDALKGPFMHEALAQISGALDRNRERVLEVVQDKSRWWIPTQVDRGVASTLVDGTLSVIEDLEKPDSELRKEFEEGILGFLNNLFESGTIERAIHGGKVKFVKSDAFEDTLETSLVKIRTNLSEGIEKDPSKVEAAVTKALLRFANRLLTNDEALARFEGQLASSAESIFTELQDPLADYVKTVIDEWETEEFVSRFEHEIGPDLQFIRINGAVLGSFIGGGLYFFERLMAMLQF